MKPGICALVIGLLVSASAFAGEARADGAVACKVMET
jgi:hypothetical protein